MAMVLSTPPGSTSAVSPSGNVATERPSLDRCRCRYQVEGALAGKSHEGMREL